MADCDAGERADDIDELLCRLTEAAARQALKSLDDLPNRADGADHDRGARSVESLTRVAATASTLRAKLQKDAAANDDHAARGRSDADLRDDAERLAGIFDAELRRRRAGTAGAADPGDQS